MQSIFLYATDPVKKWTVKNPFEQKVFVENKGQYDDLNKGQDVYFGAFLGNKKITISKTLMDFEKRLVSCDFFRVHKSHLVNLNHIEKYTRAEGEYIIMKDGSKLPLSVRKKESLLTELQKLDA